jgi:hypothetical protein
MALPGVKTCVLVNRQEVAFDRVNVRAGELLEEAGFEGKEWDLLQLSGKNDPTGGRPIDQDSILELTEGDCFRVIPGNRTFG